MEVTLYSNGCPKCRVLKQKLARKNVTFSENSNVKTLIDLGFTKVPVLEVEGKFMSFYDANNWINSIGI
jgi:glutaredoxin